MRGRRRCRLHGGLSTGPKTAEGLARIRVATTRHGRYARAHVALARLVRAWGLNGIRSARAMRDPRARAHFLQRAYADTVPPPPILDQMREQVRAELARDEQQRLIEKDR
jgi:hypothetical protein